MLTSLRIKNLALVADLTVDLAPGYNAITGETGAGKSMLIGALNLVLGQRADRNSIRGGADSCSVEAVFDVSRLKVPLMGFLEENGLEPCEEDQLLVKRTFTNSGTNRQFINGSPTTLGVLADLGELLVDIHGPHEHQSLLHPNRQLAILDAFGKLEPQRDVFAELVRTRAQLQKDKAALIIDERTYAQKVDLLRHQVREIKGAALDAGEGESLELEYKRASNGARLLELSRNAADLLAEADSSVLSQAGMLGRVLQDLQRVDASAAKLVDLHAQAVGSLGELQNELSHYADKVEVDPARLQQMEERINLLQSLKRKYGPTLQEVINFGDEAARQLQALESRDAEVERLNAELARTNLAIWRAGQDLAGRRRKLIPQLSKAVCRQLADLGFKQSLFEVEMSSLEQSAVQQGEVPLSGLDTIEFQFAPNPGELARPLRAIASSGELARVMLALKTVLAVEDSIPVLVFDEVDANIGGETARAVAEKMRQISRNRQVLCITHLAPVAAQADAHLVVEKEVKGGRTESLVRRLGETDRVKELARMLGGHSQASIQHAQSLLQDRAATRKNSG